MTRTGNEKEALLRKIRALAERGKGGEAKNAADILSKLMEKYGITEEDLDDQKRKRVEIRYSKPFEDKLLSQVIYMVMGDVPVYKYEKSHKKVRILDCTQSERIEIEAAFDFYRDHLANGLEMYYRAFVQREGIFPTPDKKQAESPEREISEEEIRLTMAIERHDRHKAIGDWAEEDDE